MLLSKLVGERFKEKPADASCISHALLARGGYIKQVGTGLFTLTPIAKKIILKIENIVREEMNNIDGQEVLFPVLMPRSLWDESGRYSSIGSEMFRLKDRNDKDMVLGMTHEEAAVHLARSENDSYKRYPFMIYQIQTKLRDEPRARAGLIRVREFTMKDAYSFHTSEADLENYYNKAMKAYACIYKRCGLEKVAMVRSSSGMMGGKKADEFMCVCDAGEDNLLICPDCKASYNQEVATTKLEIATTKIEELKEILTPDTKTIANLSDFLKVPASHLCKAVVYGYGKDKVAVCFIRADRDINQDKLQAILKNEVYILDDLSGTTLTAGFIGPLNVKESDKITVLFDNSVKDEASLVIGGGKADTHISGFNCKRDCPNAKFYDFNNVVGGDICEICGGRFEQKNGVEIGNIFNLDKKYTQAMKMQYLDENGKKQTPFMGCYGIGIGRILACLVEEHYDNYGPIWPKQVAPFDVEICPLSANDTLVKSTASSLYEAFKAAKIDVLLDDRALSVGITLADADLIAAPYRIILGSKNLENGLVEIKSRDKLTNLLLKVEDCQAKLQELLSL